MKTARMKIALIALEAVKSSRGGVRSKRGAPTIKGES